MASPEAKSKAWKEGCEGFRCRGVLCWSVHKSGDSWCRIPSWFRTAKLARKTAPTSFSQNMHPEHSTRPPVHQINQISQFTRIKNWRLFYWFCTLDDLWFNLNTWFPAVSFCRQSPRLHEPDGDVLVPGSPERDHSTQRGELPPFILMGVHSLTKEAGPSTLTPSLPASTIGKTG